MGMGWAGRWGAVRWGVEGVGLVRVVDGTYLSNTKVTPASPTRSSRIVIGVFGQSDANVTDGVEDAG